MNLSKSFFVCALGAMAMFYPRAASAEHRRIIAPTNLLQSDGPSLSVCSDGENAVSRSR